jgi:alkylhydroperoxidase family enzyme
MSRIEPLAPPFEPRVRDALTAMMPDGVPPIALFRTFAHNLPMTEAMQGWGGYELSKRLSISMRQRELVIDRVTARCGCEYEWGVHVAFFAERVGLTPAQITSLAHGDASDSCWTDAAERARLSLVDALHDTSHVDDDTWASAGRFLDTAQLLDVCLLAGWYHAISYAANAARVPLEAGAPRFAEVESPWAVSGPSSPPA